MMKLSELYSQVTTAMEQCKIRKVDPINIEVVVETPEEDELDVSKVKLDIRHKEFIIDAD